MPDLRYESRVWQADSSTWDTADWHTVYPSEWVRKGLDASDVSVLTLETEDGTSIEYRVGGVESEYEYYSPMDDQWGSASDMDPADEIKAVLDNFPGVEVTLSSGVKWRKNK